MPSVTPLKSFLLFTVAAAVLFFVRLDLPLLEPEEARYAEIPRQMLLEGRFLVPILHGENYLHKPPLLYWLVMLAYSMFGVHDVAAHLVPALAGWLTVLLCFGWLTRWLGHPAGWWGCVVLVLSPRFVYQFRILGMDGLLTLFVVGGWWSGWEMIQARRSGFFTGATGLMIGLGLLTKGPIAAVLIGGPLVLWQLSRKSFRLVPWLGVGLVSLSAAGPWYLGLWWSDPQAFRDFFVVHHWKRFLDPLDHEEPFWFYIPYLTLGMIPWSLGWLGVFQKRFRSLMRMDPVRFCALAFTICFLVFSFSGCKRPAYILPAFIPLAGILGLGFSRWCEGLLRWARWLPAAMYTALVIGYLGLLPGYYQRFSLRESVRRGKERMESEVHSLETASIASFAKRWDSIPFYLDRSERIPVVVGAEFPRNFQDRPSLWFVKAGPSWEEFQKMIPATSQWDELARGRLHVGIVRPTPASPGKSAP